MSTRIKVDTPAQIAAAVPSLIGFVPGAGSLVVVTFHLGENGKRTVGLTCRVDFPGISGVPALVRQLIPAIERGAPDVVGVVVVGWETATGEADEVYWELKRESAWDLMDCLTVQHRVGHLCDDECGDDSHPRDGQEGGWYVLDTCPAVTEPAWEPLPVDLLRPVVIAELGAVVQPSRESIAERFTRTDEPASPFDELTAWDLGGTDARDERMAALGQLDAAELLGMVETYARVARTTDGYTRDNALVLAATAAYLAGDGATASVALGEVTPGHTLAELLRMALDVTLPPSALREMLAAA
jgi:hypothetical protein